MMDVETIQAIETHTLQAWHALETHEYDRWLLRTSAGYTGRANSINPMIGSTLPLDEKIAYCDEFYSERNLPVLYRLHDVVYPSNIDTRLADLGYERYNETIVQTCDLRSFSSETDARFHYTTQLTDAWLDAFASMNSLNPEHKPIAKQMLEQNPLTCCFAWVDDVAVGLGVYSEQYIALFDIVVHPDYRGQGLGKILVSNLMQWGKHQGATTVYLQVVGTNTTAIGLYHKLGFSEHHRYWYRRKTS